MEIVQLIWEWYVFLFVVCFIVPAFTHPIETVAATVSFLTLILWKEWY